MQLQFQNEVNIEIIGFYLMHLGFALYSSDRDLWDIGLSDTDLDLLDLDLDLSPVRLEVVFSVTIFGLSRRFQDVFNTSSRRLEDQQMFVGISVCLKFDHLINTFMYKLQILSYI